MKILLIHNLYKEYGGEDKVVENQLQIYKNKDLSVSTLFENNKEIHKNNTVYNMKLLINAYSSNSVESKITEIIDKHKPDIAHIHNIYPIISPVVYKTLKEKNVKSVQTLHNYRFICPNGLLFTKQKICEKCLNKDSYYQCFNNRCYRDSYIQSLWYADIISRAYKKGWFKYINKFIALNPFMKEIMIKKGYPEEKIVIIPNYSPKVELSYNYFEKKPYFLYIGRLSVEKGIQNVLKTFKTNPKLHLKIVGDGPLKSSIEKTIEDNNISNIELIGFLSGYEKETVIKESMGVIVASEWYENFPTVVLESLSMGTPVIASSIGGLQYMIEDGKNGFLFTAGDEISLGEKLNTLASNITLVSEMSKVAYKTYMQKYTEEVYFENHIKLYKELLSQKN